MYYMKYTSKVTSKGTVTIAASLRKAGGFKPGQKVQMSLNKDNQIVIDAGSSIADFEKLRAQIAAKIPSHKKGLTGRALKEAAAKAWVASE